MLAKESVSRMGAGIKPGVESINLAAGESAFEVDPRMGPRKSVAVGVRAGRGSWVAPNPLVTVGISERSLSGDTAGFKADSEGRSKGGAEFGKDSEAGTVAVIGTPTGDEVGAAIPAGAGIQFGAGNRSLVEISVGAGSWTRVEVPTEVGVWTTVGGWTGVRVLTGVAVWTRVGVWRRVGVQDETGAWMGVGVRAEVGV